MVFITKEEYDRLKLVEEKYDQLKGFKHSTENNSIQKTNSTKHLDGSGEDPTRGDPKLQVQQILLDKKDSLAKSNMAYKPLTENTFDDSAAQQSSQFSNSTSAQEDINDWFYIGE